MSGSLFDRAGQIFLQALEVEESRRAAFVAEACAGDDALLDMVRVLLAGDDPEPGPLDAGPPLEGVAWDTPLEIGPYRVVRELGQGGMGRIYLGARADDEFEKEVAIKVVRPGLGSAAILQRFKSERQILANLDHPNIARLLDGGSLPDGRPYIVMEYVDGRRIDEYCDEEHLGVEGRLELFCTVCAAVQVAHQNLVVHRDLKPSNIFVTQGGTPKLLDFGIAKLLAPERVEFTVARTRTDEVLLTPEYASPEQVSGAAVTTASDVYSLGVILYELLTGHPPYYLAERTPLAMHRAICEEDPRRPSAQVHEDVATRAGTRTAAELARARGTKPERLRRRIAGDLDNIVLTALRKEPHRRYASAEQLAADVRCHLSGRPVAARPDTWRYRTGKLLRRNRLLASASALLVLSLAAFGASATIQSKELKLERDKAEAETVKAEFEAQTYQEVADFLVELFEGANPRENAGAQTTARELLESGKERIERLAARPAIQARLLETIGRSYMYLGANDEAEPLFARAVAICEQLYGTDTVETAQPLHFLAKMRLDAGDLDASLELFERALDIHLAQQPGNDVKVAEGHNNISLPLYSLGRMDEAMQHLQEALRIREQEDPPNYEALAVLHANLGVQASAEGRADDSLRHFEAAVAYGEELPDDHELQMNLVVLLANELKEVGRHEEAEQLAQKVLDRTLELWGEESMLYLNALKVLFLTKRHGGKSAEANELNREAIDLCRERGLEVEMAVLQAGLANELRATGELDDAEELLYEALEIQQRLLPGASMDIAYTLSILTLVLDHRQDFEEAENTILEALVILRDQPPSSTHAGILERVADHYVRNGDPELALEHLTACLEMRVGMVGETNVLIAETKDLMARAQRAAGDDEAAERLQEEALQIRENDRN